MHNVTVHGGMKAADDQGDLMYERLRLQTYRMMRGTTAVGGSSKADSKYLRKHLNRGIRRGEGTVAHGHKAETWLRAT